MMRRWFLSPGLPLALATVGTFVLANSWISQNRELVRAYDDVSRLQRSQLVIEHDEIWRDQWLIALNQEFVKPKPDDGLLVVAAHGALEGFARWQTHMEGRVAESPDEYQRELAARDLLLAQAEKFVEAKDYRPLMAVLQKLTAMSKAMNSTAELDKRFFAAVDAANDRVVAVERQVRFQYVLATGFLLLSSVLASVFLELTLRRMEAHGLGRKSRSS